MDQSLNIAKSEMEEKDSNYDGMNHYVAPLLKKESNSERMLSLLDCIDGCIFVFGMDTIVVYANQNALAYSGYTQGEISHQTFNKLLVLDKDVVDTGHFFKKIIREKKLSTQAEIIKKDKTLRQIKIVFKSLSCLDTNFFVCIFEKMTERFRIENALQESERKLSTLISNLQGMVYRCSNDQNWPMEFVSNGCKDLLGYTAEEIISNGFIYQNLIHPDDRPFVWNKVQKAVSQKKSFQFVFRVTTAAGEKKWVLERGVGVYSENGELEGLEGFITDVTEQKTLEAQLYQENRLLRREKSRSHFGLDNIVGQSDAMQQVYSQIIQASASNASVIIYGESGTGKELVAKAIHNLSERRHKPFIIVNCGAIPDTLIESEFFGYKKGAFSGAAHNKPGMLDHADGGTLFMDEIGEINFNMQVKLLRAIDGNGFTPVGGSQIRYPDIRIISATNRNLWEMVNENKFRKDFFYRINIVPIELPPLRNRVDDIPILVSHFIKKFSTNRKKDQLPLNVIYQLQNYNWLGNVRELENVIQRYITTKDIDFLNMSSPKINISEFPTPKLDDVNIQPISLQGDLKNTLRQFEKKIIKACLDRHNWHRGKATKELNIDYRTLLRKMKELDLSQ